MRRSRQLHGSVAEACNHALHRPVAWVPGPKRAWYRPLPLPETSSGRSSKQPAHTHASMSSSGTRPRLVRPRLCSCAHSGGSRIPWARALRHGGGGSSGLQKRVLPRLRPTPRRSRRFGRKRWRACAVLGRRSSARSARRSPALLPPVAQLAPVRSTRARALPPQAAAHRAQALRSHPARAVVRHPVFSAVLLRLTLRPVLLPCGILLLPRYP